MNGDSSDGPAGFIGGYHWRANSASSTEIVPGGNTPCRYCSGSRMSPGPKVYSMIDDASQTEPVTSDWSSLRITLLKVFSRDQPFGGAPKSR